MRFVIAFTTIMTLTFAVIAQAAQNESGDDFWRRFRDAVAQNDSAVISSLTRFPFEVRGPDDSEPVRRFGKKSFKGILKRVLVQPVFVQSNGKSVTKSMLQIIKEKDHLQETDYHNADFLQIEQFEFQRINGIWAFTRAYLEE